MDPGEVEKLVSQTSDNLGPKTQIPDIILADKAAAPSENIVPPRGKDAVVAWWILLLLALFLWYRNENYDRAVGVFLLTMGIIQLIEYGVYSGAAAVQSGKAMFVALWLQCLVLAIAVFVFLRTQIGGKSESTQGEILIQNIAGWNIVIFAIVLIVALIYAYITQDLRGLATTDGIAWMGSNSNSNSDQNPDNVPSTLLGYWWWLYIIGILGPFLLLFIYYAWTDMNSAVLFFYGLVAVVFVLVSYPPAYCTALWAYLAVGFGFLAWILGIIPRLQGATI